MSVSKLTKDLKADVSAHDGTPASVPGKKRTAHKAAEQVKQLNHKILCLTNLKSSSQITFTSVFVCLFVCVCVCVCVCMCV